MRKAKAHTLELATKCRKAHLAWLAAQSFGPRPYPHGRSDMINQDRHFYHNNQSAVVSISLPAWKLVCNRLIVEPFDVARQIARMPLYKVAKELDTRQDVTFSNLLIASAKSVYCVHIRQLVAPFVVALATSKNEVPCFVLQHEGPGQDMVDFGQANVVTGIVKAFTLLHNHECLSPLCDRASFYIGPIDLVVQPRCRRKSFCEPHPT